jgi:hypothetical protein
MSFFSRFSSKSRLRILSAFILLIGAATSLGIFSYSRAQSSGLPFGGLVVWTRPCSCSGNFLISVSGPLGGEFVYYPGTQAYESFNLGLQNNMWVLGLYTPGGVCSALEGECTTIPSQGTITPTVGTSPTF